MTTDQIPIKDVSDTALWVTYYRAEETDRDDALFKDPLAKLLIDERAQQIAESMKKTSAHTRHNVVIRTVMIDRFIEDLVTKNAVDAVINLGAGLDTRPYRVQLPKNLNWIEVDFEHLIEFKNKKLVNEKPTVDLKRVSLNLADRALRKFFLKQINTESKNILVLTEGVLPYLTPDQVSELAEDLFEQANIHYWIADHISPMVYKYLQNQKRTQQMKNAPFLFFPPDWFGFFESRNWKPDRIEYIPELALKLGRKSPNPWWAKLIGFFAGAKMREQFMKSSGYMIMNKTEQQ
jgi:methyltransferase (TIGR00027 family)